MGYIKAPENHTWRTRISMSDTGGWTATATIVGKHPISGVAYAGSQIYTPESLINIAKEQAILQFQTHVDHLEMDAAMKAYVGEG